MRLIALKDFARVGPLADLPIDDLKHERQVHKGARFEIGRSDKLKDVNKRDQELIAQLVVTGCVGDATDPKVVKAVEADVAA